MKASRLPKEEWAQIRAKRRSIYLIWDRKDAKSEKKGVQIFDAAHFFMEEKLEEIAKLPRGGGYIMFSDPDEGKHVAWTRKGSGAKDTRYIGHKFVDRERPIPDSILEKTFSLDTVVNMHPSYEEIEKAFYGNKEKESSEDETEKDESSESKPAAKRKKLSGRRKKKTSTGKRTRRTEPEDDPDDDDIPY
jgi:hypothetical protein